MDTELVIQVERSPGWCTWLIFVRPWLELDDFIFDITFLYFYPGQGREEIRDSSNDQKKDWPSPAFNVLLKLDFG